MMQVNRPGPTPGQQPRITEIWAWTCIDPLTDTEGIVAMEKPFPLPLVATNKATIEKFRPFIRQIAQKIEAPVRLRRFVPGNVDGVVIDVVEPWP